MRSLISALTAAFFATALAVPEQGSAQGAGAISGTFVYDATASDNVKEAINDAVAKMNFLVRPFARRRLHKANPLYQRVTISHTPRQVTVTTGDLAPVVTPADGTPINWTRENGDKLKVSTRWRNSTLQQTFRATDGQRTNTYTLSPDGRTLTMRVTVTSPRLPQPVRYKLVYGRA